MSKSQEAWENQAFTKIFNFTLNQENITTNSHLLLNLTEEFTSEGIPFPNLITLHNLERCLLFYLENQLVGSCAEFCYLAFEKAWNIKNNLQIKGKGNLDENTLKNRLNALDIALNLCTSYAGLSICFEDMFGGDEVERSSSGWLVNRLLKAPLSDDINGVSDAFFETLINRFKDDGLEELIGKLFENLNNNLINLNVSKDYLPYLKVAHRLVSYPILAEYLTYAPNFLPDLSIEAYQLESSILLGPLLKISTFPDQTNLIHKDYFLNSNGFSNVDIQSTFYTLRGANKQIINSLFEMFDKMIRASANSRQKVLELFSIILLKNQRRSGLQVDPNTVSSDRFINNVNQILLKFSQPFIDANHSKLDRIDLNYYLKSPLTELPDEARIGATNEEYQTYLQNNKKMDSPNFISHCFHLAILAFRLGFLKALNGYHEVDQEIEEIEKHLERFEATRAQWEVSPMRSISERMFNQYRQKLDELKALKLALEAYVLDDQILFDQIAFCKLRIAHLLRCLERNHSFPKTEFQLPAFNDNEDPPNELVMLPEYYFSDLVEFFGFISRECPEQLLNSSNHELILFIVAFLHHEKVVKNPYHKIKLVEVLFFFTHPLHQAREGVLGAAINTHPLAQGFLLKALMKFYVLVEQTGLSSQFHDKFNVRYNITQLLKVLWKHPKHKEQMGVLSRDMDFFVRFVNLLMNDTTYLLDESLSKLKEIHDIQLEMEDTVTFNQQSIEHRREREGLLRSDERMAKSYVALSNENVHLLLYVTEALPAPFLSDEIVTRLAAMLNYTLKSLVGPKCASLKVKEPKKYMFRPRELLKEILMIYLNLMSDKFINALALDGRSYDKGLYKMALNVVDKHHLLEGSKVEQFKLLANKVEEQFQLNSNLDEELTDVPEEFLDPLMFTLMKEPVRLPTSNTVIDLSTIKAHLLSDNKDPFNRQPLDIKDVVPEVELKEKIQKFLSSRKSG